MRCAFLLDHAAGFIDGRLSGPEADAARGHLEGCADCRALLASLDASGDPGLAAEILARTSGSACELARSRLCQRVDGELRGFDAELVDSHVRHCPECEALARALRELGDELPRLAAIDPHPGFVEAVLARTSRRPRRPTLSERWTAAASRLLERPRIAFEGAFVAAVVAGLALAASPPIASSPELTLAEAHGAMCDLEATVKVGARSAWARARAMVAGGSIHLPDGTLARLGASGQRDGRSGAKDRDREAAREERR